MRVLIVIPAYNASATVQEAIKSALAQRYDNFYVHAVDDGSTDGTWWKITEFVGLPNIGVIQRRHRGLQETVNYGVSMAKSDAVVVLGADDTLHPDFLKKTAPLLWNSKVGVVSTDMSYFGARKGLCQAGGCWPTNCVPASSLIRRKAWDEVGGFDPSVGYEDWDLWLKIKNAGWEFKILHEPLVNYRLGLNVRSKEADLRKAEYEKQIRERHGK